MLRSSQKMFCLFSEKKDNFYYIYTCSNEQISINREHPLFHACLRERSKNARIMPFFLGIIIQMYFNDLKSP